MRFAQTIRLNSNPRWWGYYIPYEQLKARLNRLHKLHTSQLIHSPSNSDEGTSSASKKKKKSNAGRGQPEEGTSSRVRLSSDVERANEADDEGEESSDEEITELEDEDEEEQQEQTSEDRYHHHQQQQHPIHRRRHPRPPSGPTPSHSQDGKRNEIPNFLRDITHTKPTLHRTASDAVLTNYPPPDSPNSNFAKTNVLPNSLFSLEKKIIVPIVEIDSSESAALLFEQEDDMFFRHLKQSVRTADEFYARMLYSLRHFVDDRKKIENSISGIQQQLDSFDSELLDSLSAPSILIHSSEKNVDEKSPLLTSIVINSQNQNQNNTNRMTDESKRNLDVKERNAEVQRKHAEREMAKDKEELLNDCNYIFQEIHKMMNFAILNVKAIEKILKKHDKLLGTDTKKELLDYFKSHSALYDLSELEELSIAIIQMYANVFENGDEVNARKKLSYGLPDQVFWTRGTYWGENLKNRLKSAEMYNVRGLATGSPTNDMTSMNKDVESDGKKKNVEVKAKILVAAISLFLIVGMTPSILLFIIGQDVSLKYDIHVLEAANRALALLILCVICWAWKVIPLFATSFIVFAGASSMRIFIDHNKNVVLNGHDASEVVVQQIGSPTVLLILCVYALASALKKCQIDRLIAIKMIKFFKPSGTSLITFVMVVSIVVSMTVSNVASPVLLVSVMSDSFTAFNLRGADNKKFVRGLLFAIMVACNVGGFVSPIASPQAAVAIGLLSQASYDMSFGMWLLFMLPLSIIILCIAYLFLVKYYYENGNVGQINSRQISKPKIKYSWSHYGTIITLSMTIIMWLVPWFSEIFGNTGIIGTIPICIIFSSGILEKSDFMNLAWDVVILVAGGSVLGAGIHSSHLLDMLAERLMQLIGSHAIYSFVALCTVTTLISIVVSHTVSSIILLPLFLRVGETFGQPQLFVLGGTAAASCAMATNVASFPNLTISELQDDKKEYYIESDEFKRVGGIMTGGCLVVLLVLGCGYLAIVDT